MNSSMWIAGLQIGILTNDAEGVNNKPGPRGPVKVGPEGRS